MAVLVIMQVPADHTTEVRLSGRSTVPLYVQLWLASCELAAELQIRCKIYIMTNLVIIDPDGEKNV